MEMFETAEVERSARARSGPVARGVMDSSHVIRNVEPGDAPSLHRLLTSPHVLDGTMRLPFVPRTVIEARISPRPGLHQLVIAGGTEVLGFAELETSPEVARIAHAGTVSLIAVAEDHRRKGIATELLKSLLSLSDDWLGLHRLSLTVWADNDGAIRLYERHGFVREGIMRDYVLRRGVFVDAIMMGRLRS